MEDLLVALGIGHFDRSGKYQERDIYDPELQEENERFADRFWERATEDPSE